MAIHALGHRMYELCTWAHDVQIMHMYVYIHTYIYIYIYIYIYVYILSPFLYMPDMIPVLEVTTMVPNFPQES